jgi:hypothetical protein
MLFLVFFALECESGRVTRVYIVGIVETLMVLGNAHGGRGRVRRGGADRPRAHKSESGHAPSMCANMQRTHAWFHTRPTREAEYRVTYGGGCGSITVGVANQTLPHPYMYSCRPCGVLWWGDSSPVVATVAVLALVLGGAQHR